MEKQDILKAILSKDAAQVAEAKKAIKELMTARATQFRADSAKFVAKSLFESAVDESTESPFKVGDKVKTRHVGDGEVHAVDAHQVTVKVKNTDPKPLTDYKLYKMPHSHAKKVG